MIAIVVTAAFAVVSVYWVWFADETLPGVRNLLAWATGILVAVATLTSNRHPESGIFTWRHWQAEPYPDIGYCFFFAALSLRTLRAGDRTVATLLGGVVVGFLAGVVLKVAGFTTASTIATLVTLAILPVSSVVALLRDHWRRKNAMPVLND